MSETYYWRQKNGKSIDVRDMEETHIKRCFRFLPKDSEWFDIFNEELERRAKEIKTEVNSNNFPVQVSIGLSRMPVHCGECPFYIDTAYYDEEAFWGDGIQHYCPFGCSHWGCLVERPADCVLVIRE